MARCQAKAALKKLEDQLVCRICENALRDPKLLQCSHVFCKKCLEGVAFQDKQELVSVRCYTCQKATMLPPSSTVADLQTASHITGLFELQDAFEKVKESQKPRCTKCEAAHSSTSYCDDCLEILFAALQDTDIPAQDGSSSNPHTHEVVACSQLEKKVRLLNSSEKTLMQCCASHQGKPLDLYCETCEELICLLCIVNKHNDHQYDVVSDLYEQQKAKIMALLKPAKVQLEAVNKAIEQIVTQSKAVEIKKDAVKSEIHNEIKGIQGMLELRKTELIHDLNERAQQKIKRLAAQKDQLETVQTQLVSHLSFVRGSLHRRNLQKLMKMKKEVFGQIEEIMNSIKSDQLLPCESPDMHFSAVSKPVQNCIRQFGEVHNGNSLEDSLAIDDDLEMAKRSWEIAHPCEREREYPKQVELVTCDVTSQTKTDEVKDSVTDKTRKYEISCQTTIQQTNNGIQVGELQQETVHIYDNHGRDYSKPIELLAYGRTLHASAEDSAMQTKSNQCEIHYQSTSQQTDKDPQAVPEGEEILNFDKKERVYPESVRSSTCELRSDINTMGSVMKTEANQCVVSHQPTRHQLPVTVESEHSPFSVTVKLPVQEFGTPVRTITGVNRPWGVTVNKQDEIVVTEFGGNCVSIFASTGEKIRSFGFAGSGLGQFNCPRGVATDDDGNILVVDSGNHRIQKFSADGRFLAAVGTQGPGQMQFHYPVGIKVNPQTKKIYVADQYNHRVQVFNHDISYYCSFGNLGHGCGQLYNPCDMAFDSVNDVYVTDYDNSQIQVYTGNGEYFRRCDNVNTGQLISPTMIAVDGEDKISVTEINNHRVSMLTSHGRYLTSFGTYGDGPQQFCYPCGITMDESGKVYICDRDNNRVLICYLLPVLCW